MTDLSTFFRKNIFLAFPLLVVAVGLDYMSVEGLKETDYINYKQWSRLFEKEENADVLIVGNSRAACHVIPPLLDSLLPIHAYNIGLLGGGIILQRHAYFLY